MEVWRLRKEFPILEEKVYGKNLVYLDNAATSQRPRSVIDKWEAITNKHNANLHRAVHKLAADATEEFEAARTAVAGFIGAESEKQVIFSSGATASLNLVAFCFGEAFVNPGDEIIVGEAEHHSNIVPWQLTAQRRGATIKVLPVDDNGCLRMDLLDGIINSKTRIVAISHVSNVLGIVNPIAGIADICHSKGCALLVDGAQGIVHQKVDVQALGCDFYAFSGHKIYAAPGTGVLYAKSSWLESFPPYMGGGEMIQSVKWSGTSYAEVPYKFEAGTQNIAGTPTLVPAVETAVLMTEPELERNSSEVKEYVMDALMRDSRIHLYGIPEKLEEKIPLFSFSVDGVHHEDLALILDKMGIAVRSGQMCAEPLMDRFGVTGMLRASFAPYNTMEEAQYFIKSLDKAINMLQ